MKTPNRMGLTVIRTTSIRLRDSNILSIKSPRERWAVTGNDLAGFPLNVAMEIHAQAGEWQSGKVTHTHPYNECLVFFGHNTDDLNYLGAELTVDIGLEHEKYTFSSPTVISIPKGTPHFPIVCNKVEKPYRFVQIGLGAEYQSSPAA